MQVFENGKSHPVFATSALLRATYFSPMHEYSVASAIMNTALSAAGKRPVQKLTLRNGALSGVFAESLIMYLEMISEERGMSGLRIEIVPEKARFRCICGTEYESDNFLSACPSCNGYEREIVAGKECRLESIEVDDQ